MTSQTRTYRATIPLLLVSLGLALNATPAGRDDDGYPRLMQGPMVGAVTDSEAKIWVRTSGAFEVSVEPGAYVITGESQAGLSVARAPAVVKVAVAEHDAFRAHRTGHAEHRRTGGIHVIRPGIVTRSGVI